MFRNFLLAALMLLPLTSCLVNDISYPDVKPSITSVKFENQVGDAIIDSDARTITVEIYETADLSHVLLEEITSNYDATITFGEGMTNEDGKIYLNLTSPVKVTLSVYESFEWTIIAKQEIKRYFKIKNQVGEEDINVTEKMVVVRVAETNSLTDVTVLQAKLGIDGSVMSPDPLTVKDFVEVVHFDVTYDGVTEKWGVRVIPSAVDFAISSINAWAYSAQVYGTFSGSSDEISFEYRKKSEDSWLRCEDITFEGINAVANIKGLQDNTEYVVKMTSGDETSESEFVTEEAAQIPNSNYDLWFRDSKNAWFPRASQNDEIWWDTANVGANTLSPVNPTTPEESFVAVSGKDKKAAKLETKSVLGIMAAGNMYSGRYLRTEGVSAILEFGVPFESRPVGLRGYYSYSPKTIDKAKDPYTALKGRTDMCQIYIMLTAWDKPFEVNSGKSQYIDMNDPDILAFREFVSDADTGGEYKEFFIHLDDEAWRDKTRKPKHILIVSCASRYGDYFTGAVGSVMYVDEFELVYDESEIPDDGSVLVIDKDFVNSNVDIEGR